MFPLGDPGRELLVCEARIASNMLVMLLFQRQPLHHGDTWVTWRTESELHTILLLIAALQEQFENTDLKGKGATLALKTVVEVGMTSTALQLPGIQQNALEKASMQQSTFPKRTTDCH